MASDSERVERERAPDILVGLGISGREQGGRAAGGGRLQHTKWEYEVSASGGREAGEVGLQRCTRARDPLGLLRNAVD